MNRFTVRTAIGTMYIVEYSDGSVAEVDAQAYERAKKDRPDSGGKVAVTSYAKDRFPTPSGMLEPGDVAYLSSPDPLVCLPTQDGKTAVVPLRSRSPGVTWIRSGDSITTSVDVPNPAKKD